jgi:hypothetical protein
MKNLLKAMANISRTIGGGYIDMIDSPTFRMSMKEYEDMGIKVGDKVTIEATVIGSLNIDCKYIDAYGNVISPLFN